MSVKYDYTINRSDTHIFSIASPCFRDDLMYVLEQAFVNFIEVFERNPCEDEIKIRSSDNYIEIYFIENNLYQ